MQIEKGISPVVKRLLKLLLPLVLVPVVAVVGAGTPASAAFCNQLGHSYTIYNGVAYESGWEGGHQNGIQTLVLPAGTRFQVGAAGTYPGNWVEFGLYADEVVPPWGFPVENLARIKAGGNCVANQQWVDPFPRFGTYQVTARYFSWVSNRVILETSVYVIFI